MQADIAKEISIWNYHNSTGQVYREGCLLLRAVVHMMHCLAITLRQTNNLEQGGSYSTYMFMHGKAGSPAYDMLRGMRREACLQSAVLHYVHVHSAKNTE